ALSSHLYHFRRHTREGVDFHDASDLREESLKQPEVAPGHPNNRGQRVLISHSLLWQRHPGRHPLLPQQGSHLGGTQRTERVDEAHSRVELRVTRQPLLKTRQADEHDPKIALVKDITHLL